MAWTTEDRCILKLLFEPAEAKAALAEPEAPAMKPDWNLLVRKAQREGVSALLFHNIKQHHLEHLIPRDSLQTLSHDYRINLKRNMATIGKLREVLTRFHEAGIPCIVLKGIALAEHVYPNIATRGMSDADILIRKDDLFKADHRLSSLGYVPHDSFAAQAIHNPVGYLASLEYRKAGSEPLSPSLHLHWHPVNTSVPATMFVGHVDLDRLWDMAVETEIADCPVLMLCPEHLIIYLCEHALRVGHSLDRLILICDIHLAIKTYGSRLDWDSLAAESRQLGLSRLVYFGLSLVGHYAAPHVGLGCIASLKPEDISPGERFFLHLQRGNRRIRGSSYLIYLAMNRGFFPKLGFILRTFFPPSQIILQRQYRKDAAFSYALYLSRIGEIFSHLVKSLASERKNKRKNSDPPAIQLT